MEYLCLNTSQARKSISQHSWSEISFKGTVVNRACPCSIVGSLEITPTVPVSYYTSCFDTVGYVELTFAWWRFMMFAGFMARAGATGFRGFKFRFPASFLYRGWPAWTRTGRISPGNKSKTYFQNLISYLLIRFQW